MNLVTEQLVSNTHAWFVADEVTMPPRRPQKNHSEDNTADPKPPRKVPKFIHQKLSCIFCIIIFSVICVGILLYCILNFAASNDHTEVEPKNKTDGNASSYSYGDRSLHNAVWTGNIELVKMLLEKKADVNARKTDGATPLFLAAIRGHTEIVKLLLDYKADVNRGLPDGDTPLHTAAWNGHPEVVKILLENKADVNARKRPDGDTPLHAAAWNGHLEVVKILLEKKADVNARKCPDGATALYLATGRNHTEIVKVIVDNQADVNASLDDGDKPLHTRGCEKTAGESSSSLPIRSLAVILFVLFLAVVV